MELRSGRRLRCSQQLADRISALPDDLLLLILARLRCVGTAVCTGALSRRWRNLWRLSLSAVAVFRKVQFSSLESALACVSPAVSLLEIHVPMILKFLRSPSGQRGPRADVPLAGAGITSLLRAATRLEPEEFVFVLPQIRIHGHVDLPCFHRATAITLESCTCICLRVQPGAEFAALDTLSLSGYIVGLDALLPQCPRLRVLQLDMYGEHHTATVHSPSLRELFVYSIGSAHRVDIVAPLLRKFTMSLRPHKLVSISIVAPIVETISWRCSYICTNMAMDRWALDQLRLQTAESEGQLPSLHIHANICWISYRGREAIFKQEIMKHMFVAFSALELHLVTSGHSYREFVFHLIGMNQICSVMQRLKVVLRESKVKENCPTDCRCCPPIWRVQAISLIALEEIQIDGFEGEVHEFDFLKLVFKSAPMLKRVVVNLTHKDSSSSKACTGLNDLFRSCSAVECCVYLSTGEYVLHI